MGLPETNSSSSHSISISYNDEKLVVPTNYRTKYGNINIVQDTLYVPAPPSYCCFGSETGKYNDLLIKLWYVCSFFCNDIDTGSGHKSIEKLKRMLKNIFNVSEVVFEWDQNYFNEIKKKRRENSIFDLNDVLRLSPEVDGNSWDVIYEICENEQTLKQFLLSPLSWLYTGGDYEIENPDLFYRDTQIIDPTPEFIVSFDLGGEIGRVDLEISSLCYGLRSERDSFLNCFYIDSTGTAHVGSSPTMEFSDKDPDVKLLKIYFEKFFFDADGKIKILFNTRELYTYILQYGLKFSEELFRPSERAIKTDVFSTLKKFKEGRDYMFIDVSITSKYLGKIC